MVFSLFKGSGDKGLSRIDQEVVAMVADCRHTFDAAISALLYGADPHSVGKDVEETDQRINEAEQSIRRHLVIHASVHGSQAVPEVLGSILVIKKLERIGDQNKNIWDLASEGVSFVSAPDYESLNKYATEISGMFGEVMTILGDQDDQAAGNLEDRADHLLDEFDDLVVEQVHSHGDASHAVPRALLYRYFKRIVANLSNVSTSVNMPLDQVDYHHDGTDADE